MKRFAVLPLLLLLSTSVEAAEPVRTVRGTRVHLSDVVSAAPEDLAGIDLGAAPPAGSSRLIDRSTMARAIVAAGADPKEVKLPRVVRVVVESRRLGPEDIAAAAEPAIRSRLAKGVTLKRVNARRSVTVPASATLAQVSLPKLPRRVGTTTITVTLEWHADGAVAARAPVAAVLDIDETGARPTVARGARVYLIIEKGAARIAATAVALADADEDEIGRFRVESTQKVMRARVVSPTTARVVGGGA
ncbi:MAG: flagella basal body P-ring formation protein FlgA [Polyangiaceae bacterium]